MVYTNKENLDCINCNKSGLAVLPVRYSVIPNNVDAALPPTLGNKVTEVRLKHHKYALRTLRQGFLYLFYEKHAHGTHIRWEIYSVSTAGTLWKQISPGAIEAVTQERCSRKEHSLPASIIAIDSPERCGRVWMAFSEHAWSSETFKALEQDGHLRDRRMQTFAPAVWIKARGYRHGIEATEAALNNIIEYKSGFPLSTLGRNNVSEISKPDGSYDKNGLRSCATRYPITVRRDDKRKLVELMTQVGEVTHGPAHAPIVIALWDSVGITHELNGYRNDATGWIEKYGIERELEIGALSAIEGAKLALKQRETNNAISGIEAGVFKWDAEFTRRRLTNYEAAYPGDVAGRARQEDLCKRWERDAATRIPSSIARRRENYVRLSDPEWKDGMVEVDKVANQAIARNTTTGKSAVETRDELIQARTRTAEIEATEAWSKYEAKLDTVALKTFRKNYANFISAAAALADERTEDVVAWMKSSYLQDALLEFHPLNVSDGVAFENAVGDIMLGISSSPAGLTIIKEWINEAKASDGNLLWRAFALNQIDGISAVNTILDEVIASKEVSYTDTALDAVRDSTKHLAKLADLSKKALSLHNTLRKAEVYRVPTGGIEKILMSVGNLLFQPFLKKRADWLSEKLILGLLLARSGAQYTNIMSLLASEAKFGRAGRAETMFALRLVHDVASQRSSSEFLKLKQSWEKLAKDADTTKVNENPRLAGGFNEAKELRFGMIATIVQMVYVTKLYLDAEADPQNKKLQGELWAAGISLSAGLADLGATAIKGLHNLKDAAPGFQALKLAGGILSAGSAWIVAHQDYENARKNGENGDTLISFLCYTKVIFSGAGGASSVITAVSYTKPAFEMLAAKLPNTVIGRSSAIIPRIGSRVASRLLLGRALIMLGGIWFSVATVAIQFLIWKFSDDKLQEWCEHCAFGINRKKKLLSPKNQKTDFENALMEVI
ncbi:T6SS effector BTH_I2691 family protein [Massilia sp. 2TAF26]|uniref:T6SS effector BTH_I2691 family protein n=1 Tax=Massilia sp. 2TAF26 TaxID=3233012 RepID=UPI003F9DEC84